MSWFWTRYTAGVIIASINIVGFVKYFISIYNSYVHYDNILDRDRGEYLKSEAIRSMLLCAVAVLISILFIVGIFKRYQYMIIPWLLLCVYIIFETILIAGSGLFEAVAIDLPILTILVIFVIVVLVLEIAIFWFSYSFFKEIHEENKGNSQLQSEDTMAERNFI
ncbi:uncharacterized protein LOC124420994 isoform X2 [Lucilia cuprina]|uniref:uncharacterized protein LOC124420994 isoform X2 n=1 Tax=Lucilia cuprina TaxID=7375 RepID=UPI001F051D04|nr:uncharacterized protein LOC124420994 isoform X2 [Lucilia cuprina]